MSTAAGQFRLILDALEIQAFRQILAMPQITLPVAGGPALDTLPSAAPGLMTSAS